MWLIDLVYLIDCSYKQARGYTVKQICHFNWRSGYPGRMVYFWYNIFVVMIVTYLVHQVPYRLVQ